MWTWVAWGLFLIVQNASFTFVSRARNSGSYGLHGIAAICSNGVFIATQFLSFGFMLNAITTGTIQEKVTIAVFYTACTTIGSLGMHWIGVNYIEKGKRKVGA